jgi:hypothetical protein
VLTVDQEQPFFTSGPPLAITNSPTSEQKLAQIVTVGLAGPLVQIQLPVGCESGTLIVEIVELDGDFPGTRILGGARVPAADLPLVLPAMFVPIDLDRGIRMSVGDRFAIVLRNETGHCGLATSTDGDTYSAGKGFWDARPSPPGWRPLSDFASYFDHPFKTVVDVPGRPPDPGRRSNLCSVIGFGTTFLPDWAPVCRCLQDASLREGRCGLLHPSVYMFRRVPGPIAAGQPFKVRWTVMPLAPLTGVLTLREALPPGFQSPVNPLMFPVGQIPPGASLTLEYTAVAGKNMGDFDVNTQITLFPANQKPEDGMMKTIIEVGTPPK